MLSWVHDLLEDDLCLLLGFSPLTWKDYPHLRHNNRKGHRRSQKQWQDILHHKVSATQLNAFLPEDAYIIYVSDMQVLDSSNVGDIPRHSKPAKLAGKTNEYAPTLLPTATAKRAPYCTRLLEFVAVKAGS